MPIKKFFFASGIIGKIDFNCGFSFNNWSNSLSKLLDVTTGVPLIETNTSLLSATTCAAGGISSSPPIPNLSFNHCHGAQPGRIVNEATKTPKATDCFIFINFLYVPHLYKRLHNLLFTTFKDYHRMSNLQYFTHTLLKNCFEGPI